MTDAQKLLEDVAEAMNREPPWDYERARAALRVAIKACANVAEQQRPMVDCQGIMRLGFLQGGMEIAGAIRALLPPEETP